MKLKGILKWLGRRLREPSTYAGAAAVATSVGLPGVAQTIGQVGQVAVIVAGSVLMGATTSVHTPLQERPDFR